MWEVSLLWYPCYFLSVTFRLYKERQTLDSSHVAYSDWGCDHVVMIGCGDFRPLEFRYIMGSMSRIHLVHAPFV